MQDIGSIPFGGLFGRVINVSAQHHNMSRLKCHNKCTKEAPPCHLLIIQRGGPDSLKGNGQGNDAFLCSTLSSSTLMGSLIQNGCIFDGNNLGGDETSKCMAAQQESATTVVWQPRCGLAWFERIIDQLY